MALAARGLGEATEAPRRDARVTHADPLTGAASGALCAALQHKLRRHARRDGAGEVCARGALAVLARAAKACCSDACVRAAVENLQIHGGIGFTW